MPSSSMAAPASTTSKAGSPSIGADPADSLIAQFELSLIPPQALMEPVSGELMDVFGALPVSVEDADAVTEAEHGWFGEPCMHASAAGWERSTLKALFESEAAASDAMTLLLAQDWVEGLA